METKKQDPEKSTRHIPKDPQVHERFRGCLLGGAVGDALGAPVEFMQRSDIVERFGELGIRDYLPAYG
jgi:ADP-ribosyl-[dinitrogen reductase] hydrolase